MPDTQRTCEDFRDVIALSVSSDAILSEIAEAREHLTECTECRDYLKKLRNDDQELAGFVAGHEQRIAALKNRTVTALADPPVGRAPNRAGWQRILATGPRRVAASVAAVASVVFLVVFLQGPKSSFDAWADVVEMVRQATSARFRLRDMGGSNVEARQTYSQRGTAHLTFEDGELVEALYADFEDQELVYLAYPLKIAARMTMDQTMADDFREHDPAATFDFLQEYEYEDLGRRRIDGRSTVGIRITDARFLAERMEHAELELWVDPKSKLPVRFDVTGEVAGRSRDRHVRFYDFRWNEPLAENEFKPDIPADFDVSSGIHLQVDEEHFLEGLRLFADVVDRYPSSLAYESLKTELWRSEDARRRSVGPMVLKMFQIRIASDFYGELVKDDRGVVYYGHTVRPGEGRRVLMRWQDHDGRYRVVFGDLSVDTVDAVRLVELEGRR